ncbi:uncharacterized protein LOC106753179 [Vigna radiata var. radiata]|uniref:Uncharacterized protein LOC106753179 n=1 Tax=Vigna radiata var. radiata TaxID=3916 RepID=A0A1S3T9L2_VIGRR|nr:uncharacterized protein LOC106753179 [Vigna radiata var. radiata]
MVIVCVESSLESSGRGRDGGGVGGGDSGGSSSTGSSDSGSNSFPKEPSSGEVEGLANRAVLGGDDSVAQEPTPVVLSGRIFHGAPLFLLQGGMTVDPVALVPVGGLRRIDGYD